MALDWLFFWMTQPSGLAVIVVALALEHLACHAGGHVLKGKLKTKGTHLTYTAA